jgi:hypothetical protein
MVTSRFNYQYSYKNMQLKFVVSVAIIYLGKVCYRKNVTGNGVTGSDVSRSDVTGSDISHVTGSDVTGSDVISRAFFLLE